MDNAPEGIVLYDAEGRFDYTNKRYRELFHEISHLLKPGARRDDVRDAFYSAGTIPAVIGQVAEFKAEMERQRKAGERPERQHPNGIWIQYSDHNMPDGSIVSIRTDITGIKKREEQLRQAQKWKRSANSPAAWRTTSTICSRSSLAIWN
ncbi:MAG: hypothetical protein CMM31_02465 [Rhodospirillaceae bacterium]|nr:hypothetical protein [Rhodospirillaceae bacterium]